MQAPEAVIDLIKGVEHKSGGPAPPPEPRPLAVADQEVVELFVPKRMSLVSIAFLSRSEFGALTGGGGPLLCRLARCQAQAGQVELAVLGVAVRQIAWHDLRGNGAQPGDYSTRFVESAHMGIARGKSAV